MDKCQEAFEKAARIIAVIPQDYINCKIKDNIINQNDWDALNTATCKELAKIGCVIVEEELDDFWESNETFGDLLNYIRENCNC